MFSSADLQTSLTDNGYSTKEVKRAAINDRVPQVGDMLFDMNVGSLLKLKAGNWWLTIPADASSFDYLNPLLVVDDAFVPVGLTDYSYVRHDELFEELTDSKIWYPKHGIYINYETKKLTFADLTSAESSFGGTVNRLQSAVRSSLGYMLFQMLRAMSGSTGNEDSSDVEDDEGDGVETHVVEDDVIEDDEGDNAETDVTDITEDDEDDDSGDFSSNLDDID